MFQIPLWAGGFPQNVTSFFQLGLWSWTQEIELVLGPDMFPLTRFMVLAQKTWTSHGACGYTKCMWNRNYENNQSPNESTSVCTHRPLIFSFAQSRQRRHTQMAYLSSTCLLMNRAWVFLQALWLYRWNLLTKSWQNSGDFWEGNDSRCVPAGGFLDAGGSDTPSFARRRLLACSTQLCRLGKLFFTPGLQRQISFFRTAMSKFPL